MTEFFIDMIPPTSTHQERGCTIVNGKRKYYDRSNGAARQKLKAFLALYRPKEPAQGAVQLIVKWCFPVKGKHINGEPYIKTKERRNPGHPERCFPDGFFTHINGGGHANGLKA